MVALASPLAVLTLALLLSGCAAGGAPAAGSSDSTDAAVAQLQRQQAALTARARAGLEQLSCPSLPTAARLQGLPQDPLDCLGRGQPGALNAGDGRPTVLNLWASWCLPCRVEMPVLEEVSRQAGDAARFVGIDTEDEPDPAAALLLDTGVRYEQRADPDGIARSALRAVGLPATAVYDARGRLVAKKVGAVDAAWLRDALRRAGAPVAAAGR